MDQCKDTENFEFLSKYNLFYLKQHQYPHMYNSICKQSQYGYNNKNSKTECRFTTQTF